MNVRLTKEQKIKVLNADDVYAIMRQVLLREKKIDRNKEHFWIVCLAANNRILMIELISLGTLTATVVEPVDVFSFALQKQAVKLIMVHNHPSGELQPSVADVDLTERMLAIGKFVKVPVIDHLIISEEDYFSFQVSGELANIEKHSPFDLTFANVDQLLLQMKSMEKKQQKELGRVKKELEGKVGEIAKKALEEGLTIEQVVKLTGLTKEQVLKLDNMSK